MPRNRPANEMVARFTTALRCLPLVLALAMAMPMADARAQGEAVAPKAVGQWLAEIRQASPAVDVGEDILAGAVLATTYRPMLQARFSPRQQDQLAAYRRWVAETGDGLIAAWLADGAAAVPPPLLPLVQATYMLRAWGNGGPRRTAAPEPVDEYIRTVEADGRAAMAKGFREGVLSPGDIAALRAYAVYAAMRLTEVRLLPFELGLVDDPATGRHFRDGWSGFKPGDPMPRMRLPALTEAGASEDGTDELRQDDAAFLRPHGVSKLLEIIAAYPGGKPSWPEPGPGMVEVPRAGRPTLLVMGYAPDVFLKICLPVLGVIHHAYGDAVDIWYVNVNYHDTYATGPVLAGAEAGGESVRLCHPESLAQRARAARALYATYPGVAVPCLLDTQGQAARNAYRVGGGAAQFFLVDAAGELACVSGGWYGWTGGNYPDNVLWANEIEIQIRALLANGGRRPVAASSPAPKSGGRIMYGELRPARRAAFAGRQAAHYAGGKGQGRFLWLTGRIAEVADGHLSVSPDPGEVAATIGHRAVADRPGVRLGPEAMRNWRALEAWQAIAAANGICRLAIGDDTQLFLNGEEAEPEDFKAGDVVGAWLDLNGAGPAGLARPLQIRASRPNIPRP